MPPKPASTAKPASEGTRKSTRVVPEKKEPAPAPAAEKKKPESKKAPAIKVRGGR